MGKVFDRNELERVRAIRRFSMVPTERLQTITDSSNIASRINFTPEERGHAQLALDARIPLGTKAWVCDEEGTQDDLHGLVVEAWGGHVMVRLDEASRAAIGRAGAGPVDVRYDISNPSLVLGEEA